MNVYDSAARISITIRFENRFLSTSNEDRVQSGMKNLNVNIWKICYSAGEHRSSLFRAVFWNKNARLQYKFVWSFGIFVG